MGYPRSVISLSALYESLWPLKGHLVFVCHLGLAYVAFCGAFLAAKDREPPWGAALLYSSYTSVVLTTGRSFFCLGNRALGNPRYAVVDL